MENPETITVSGFSFCFREVKSTTKKRQFSAHLAHKVLKSLPITHPDTLAALFILIQYLYRISGKRCRAEDSTYFDCDYAAVNLFAAHKAKLPDFEED